jgi:hypothetical protein
MDNSKKTHRPLLTGALCALGLAACTTAAVPRIHGFSYHGNSNGRDYKYLENVFYPLDTKSQNANKMTITQGNETYTVLDTDKETPVLSDDFANQRLEIIVIGERDPTNSFTENRTYRRNVDSTDVLYMKHVEEVFKKVDALYNALRLEIRKSEIARVKQRYQRIEDRIPK